MNEGCNREERRKMAVKNGVKEISEREFDEKINNKLGVVDFWTSWCMPCLMMAPVLEDLSEKFRGKIDFAKVNVDENEALAQKFKISSIPCLIVFREGKEVDRIVGNIPAVQLEEKLGKLL